MIIPIDFSIVLDLNISVMVKVSSFCNEYSLISSFAACSEPRRNVRAFTACSVLPVNYLILCYSS